MALNHRVPNTEVRAMYCNDTSCKSIMMDRKYSDSAKRVSLAKAALWAGYFREIVTPENSASDHLIVRAPRSRGLGIAKALFWTGASILIGLILANLCS